ncbi:MAG: hypothetical protein U5L02_16390 [Rheinheimera sp.]|nr:hypothetical protein [Rheinheimera sp.]
MSENVATIAISIPEGVDFRLGAKINVQGYSVECFTIDWRRNSILQASALEQRLEVALDILENSGTFEKHLDAYNSRLKELKESDDLMELEGEVMACAIT